MLEYINNNNDQKKSLKVLVHHDDPVREFSYDKGAVNVLKKAQIQNWTMINMKDDFLNIFPLEK